MRDVHRTLLEREEFVSHMAQWGINAVATRGVSNQLEMEESALRMVLRGNDAATRDVQIKL